MVVSWTALLSFPLFFFSSSFLFIYLLLSFLQ